MSKITAMISHLLKIYYIYVSFVLCRVPSPEKSEIGWAWKFKLSCFHCCYSAIIIWSRNRLLFFTCRKIQIPVGFPAEHPYTSHMPKFQVFPSLESPDDIRKGRRAVLLQPTLPPTAPASAPDPTILEKTKGHFDRRELVSIQKESERKALTWPEHNLLQVKQKSNKSWLFLSLLFQSFWTEYSFLDFI